MVDTKYFRPEGPKKKLKNALDKGFFCADEKISVSSLQKRPFRLVDEYFFLKNGGSEILRRVILALAKINSEMSHPKK